MQNCQFDSSHNVAVVVYLTQTTTSIINCIFSNNSGDHTVILTDKLTNFVNSSISSNNMTGITGISTTIKFSGHNVIQNNKYSEGAGITLLEQSVINVNDGELLLYNNTAYKHGGAILAVKKLDHSFSEGYNQECTIKLSNFSGPFPVINFSGNRAEGGGSDIYGATLMGCYNSRYDPLDIVLHVGQPNETSWYFDTPLMNHFISVTLTDSPPCPQTPSWSVSATPPLIYQTALIGPCITYKRIQD